jgi:hypothetical protein
LPVLADDPKGRFDFRSLPGQVFWLVIAIAAMNIAGFGVGIGLWLLAPPMHNVGAALLDTIAGSYDL